LFLLAREEKGHGSYHGTEENEAIKNQNFGTHISTTGKKGKRRLCVTDIMTETDSSQGEGRKGKKAAFGFSWTKEQKSGGKTCYVNSYIFVEKGKKG